MASVLLAVAVLAVSGVLIFLGYKGLRDDQAQALRRELDSKTIDSIQRSYDADLRLYDKKVSDYNTCLTNAQSRVDGRLNFRAYETAQAHGFHDLLITFFPDSDLAARLADQDLTERLQRLDENEPALELDREEAKCVKPGPEPDKPKELG